MQQFFHQEHLDFIGIKVISNMRFVLLTLLGLAVTVIAAPQPEAATEAIISDAKAVAVKERTTSFDGPILDEVIQAHEKEKRTANLSPINNIRNGKAPHHM
jgi:hypothetical protein